MSNFPLAILQTSMETIVTTGLGLVVKIATAIDNASTVRQKCRILSKQIETIRGVLQQIEKQAKDRKHFSSNDEAALNALVEALRRAARFVEDLTKSNNFKLTLMAASWNENLKDVSNEIQICLGSVILMTVGLQGDLKKDLRDTTDLLRKFRDEHKAESTRSASEDAEIRKVLEAVKNQENPDPMQVLAEYYNTDPESIRTDLQEFKEWRAQSKADQLYEQLLLVISELEEKSCHACTRTISSMEELQCPICRMQFTDPVIALPSGITYCRSCLNEGLLADSRCAATRLEVTSSVENRVVANILQMPQHRMARNVPSQLPPARRLDVPNAAEAFQSRSPGSILVGLTALQIHCKRVRGRKEIIQVNGLVSYLVKFALSTERERPPGSLEIALVILEDLTALNGPPEDVLCDTELEVVHICLREEGLEHLVALMCTGTANCRLRAAQVMVNAMEGSFECLCFARTLNRLVTAFYDLAVGDREGHKVGLAGLGLLAHRESSIAENHGRKDEVVVEVLMELIRNGLGVQEALVALAQVVASSQSNSIFSALQDGGTHLVWLVETMAAGDGRNAAVKILLFMVEDLERGVASNRGAGVSSKEIPSNKVLAPRLLKIIEDLTDGKKGLGGAEEDCILLLSYVLKYGGCRLEPDQVVFLSDIVLQETASVKSRIQILEMCAESIKNMRPIFDPTRLAQLLQLVKPQLGDSTLRSGLLKMMCSLLRVPEWYEGFEGVRVEVEDVPTCFGTFCSVAAHDTNELCRGYAIVALKILATADHKILKQLRTALTLKQLVQVLQSKGPDEVSGAAAALIGMLVSDTEPDSEEVVRKALMYFVEFLQNETTPFKEEAAKALVHLICNKWEVARDWVAASETNVLAGLVSFAWQLPAHSEWRGQLYESLTLMCSDTHCKPLVVQAGGQRLLMEAFQSGSHTAASQGAALALIELVTSGKPLQDVDHGTVVVAVKGKLRREKVDPTMVGAFVRLCENADTGRLVLEHGGIEVLLDVMQRSTECCSAAALGLAKLASLKPDQDDGDTSSNPHSAPCQPADRIVKAKGIGILLGSAGSGCIPAAEALNVLVEEPSAKVELAENVGALSEMGKDPGRMQDLVLSVMSQLSWPDVPQQSVAKLLQGDFLDRLLGALKFPSSPSAATAMRILRKLLLAFPVFRDNVLKRGEGAVKELLQVLKGSPPTGLKECAVTTLEVFVLEETGRQQWIEQDGIKVVLDVLQESSVHGQVRLHALNILVSLASPPLPKPVRRRIWNQICTAQIFRAVVEELDTEALSPPGTRMAAIRLLIACVGEASDVSELCGTLREQKLPRALAKLRHYYCDEEVVAESHKLVILLAGKSRRTRLALQLEIDKEDKAHKENAAERQAET